MKAAQIVSYNKNNIALTVTDVPAPRPGAQQVLVKISTAGVNPLDNMISRGEVKLITPYTLPQIAGNEIVGRVEALGEGVTSFKVGERVFARLPLNSIGAFAEYVAVDAAALAGVPLTALTVMQAFDLMGAQPGKTIFISGGTGGVGAMAIPLAKAKGLTVITNGSASGKERMLGLGADRFIDYKTENYAETLSGIDYVLDTLGGDETEKQMSIMAPGGQLVSLRGMPNKAFAQRMGMPFWKQLLFGAAGRTMDRKAQKYGVTYHFIFVESNGAQLQQVADIFAERQTRSLTAAPTARPLSPSPPKRPTQRKEESCLTSKLPPATPPLITRRLPTENSEKATQTFRWLCSCTSPPLWTTGTPNYLTCSLSAST